MTTPTFTITNADALDTLRALPDSSVDLIATDPPYFRVKGEAWDNAWDDAGAFLAWMGELADEWRRVLKPNGSLYVFASPQMAARVECVIAERFDVLNSLVWRKRIGHHQRASREALRAFHSGDTERIVFAQQHGADGSALRGSGYAAAAAELHAGVFEPLREYLLAERDRAGVTNRQVDAHLGTNGMAGHYFGASQWSLPKEDVYLKLRELFRQAGAAEPLRREYEPLRREYEDLRREYEDLRREYEDLRRPFALGPASGARPHTTVWEFEGASMKRGRHVCEKPLAMMEHIVATSSRPGDLVLDCFAGSGVTGEAALRMGRRFHGVELDPKWAQRATERLERVASEPEPETLF